MLGKAGIEVILRVHALSRDVLYTVKARLPETQVGGLKWGSHLLV
ncbi:MAG TPA: hypothetical protein PLN81_02680 [Bacillota bacterium]|nr:hypothetical protein [Bacillota bacterium]HOP53167.1 hypothetical protein [Bacillota bacterium]HPT60482.1 hypothetical protein [Bacillota bacterium]